MPADKAAAYLSLLRTTVSLLEQSIDPKVYKTPHRQIDYEVRVKLLLQDIHKMKEFRG